MTIENLNILYTMPFDSDKTKLYRVIVNTYRRKKTQKQQQTRLLHTGGTRCSMKKPKQFISGSLICHGS